MNNATSFFSFENEMKDLLFFFTACCLNRDGANEAEEREKRTSGTAVAMRVASASEGRRHAFDARAERFAAAREAGVDPPRVECSAKYERPTRSSCVSVCVAAAAGAGAAAVLEPKRLPPRRPAQSGSAAATAAPAGFVQWNQKNRRE